MSVNCWNATLCSILYFLRGRPEPNRFLGMVLLVSLLLPSPAFEFTLFCIGKVNCLPPLLLLILLLLLLVLLVLLVLVVVAACFHVLVPLPFVDELAGNISMKPFSDSACLLWNELKSAFVGPPSSPFIVMPSWAK